MDAIAVTLASAGRYLGVAPLGTSLTDEQAAQLAAPGSAATRSWPPTPTSPARSPPSATSGCSPRTASTPATPGSPTAWTPPTCSPSAAPQRSPPPWPAASRPALGDQLLAERLDNLAPEQARVAAMRVLAARPEPRLGAGHRPGARPPPARPAAGAAATCATRSRRGTPTRARRPRASCSSSSEVRARLEAAAAKPPAERWAPLARELDPRLLEQGDWPATAAMLQQAHEQGHDVGAATRALVAEAPLGDSPARDLRYRIVSRLDVTIDAGEVGTGPTRSQGAARDRHDPGRPKPPRPGSPRR